MTMDGRALALDIGGTKLAAGIVDDRGVAHRVAVESTSASAGADQALERAVTLAGSVLAAERAAGGDVIAAGVSTMGITREDRVLFAPNVPGWAELRIPGRLAGAFGGLPVTVINDVKAATLAELTWGSLRGTETGVYVNLGTGAAAGLVVGGRVVSGAHGAAGEFGYLAGSIPPARVDGTGPVEEVIGGAGAAALASRELGRAVTVEQLFRDPDAKRVLSRLLDDIALWTANLAVVIDPEVLVLGGGFMRTPEPILNRVREVTGLMVPFPPLVAAARYGADAALAGAGAAALGAT
jgi:glucokinase